MRRILVLAVALAGAGCDGSAPPPPCQDAGPCALVDGGAGECCGFGTDCIDLGSDVNNCGSCGLVCLPGQTCIDALCD